MKMIGKKCLSNERCFFFNKNDVTAKGIEVEGGN